MSSDEAKQRKRVIARPLVPPGPLADLKHLIYELYLAAGAPGLDEITTWIERDGRLDGRPGRDTIARIIGKPDVPAAQHNVTAVVTVLARTAAWDVSDAVTRARDLWIAARFTVIIGVPLAEVTDPFTLEVHRPVQADTGGEDLDSLPLYIERSHDHDHDLAAAVETATAGRSAIAVLVGGSSTGKTRACWQAIQKLPEGWPALVLAVAPMRHD